MQSDERHPMNKSVTPLLSRRRVIEAAAGFSVLATPTILCLSPSYASPLQLPVLEPGCTGFVTAGDRYQTMYLWAYKADSGHLYIHAFGYEYGKTPQEYPAWPPSGGPGAWESGFSDVIGLSLEGNRGPYVLSYRRSDGRCCIHRINNGGDGFSQKYNSTLEPGFTALARTGDSHDSSSRNYVWAYRADDSLVCIYEIQPDGSGIAQKFRGAWAPGFTHFAGYNHGSLNCVFAYRQSDGAASIQQVSSNGTRFEPLRQFNLEAGFTEFASTDWGFGTIWAYRQSDGTVNLLKAATPDVLITSWRPGFSKFCKFILDSDYVWAYRDDGKYFLLRLDEIHGATIKEVAEFPPPQTPCAPGTC